MEAVDEVLEVRQRRPPRIFADGVPRAPPGGAIHGEDAIELRASRVAQGMGDAPVEAPVDLGPATARLFEQGREPGQLEPIPNELLDRDVHEVGQVVLRLGRIAYDLGDEGSRLAVEGSDVEERADDGDVPASCAGHVIAEETFGPMVGAQAAGDVSDDRLRDVTDRHEVAEPLERLEKDEEAQPHAAPGRGSHDESEFFGSRRVDLRQVGRRHALFQPGIGGLMGSGHGPLTTSPRTPRGRGRR